MGSPRESGFARLVSPSVVRHSSEQTNPSKPQKSQPHDCAFCKRGLNSTTKRAHPPRKKTARGLIRGSHSIDGTNIKIDA